MTNKKVQSLEQCSQLQLLKASSHRFELSYILYQNENLSQGRRAYYNTLLSKFTGIPPACAGKTERWLQRFVRRRDHPRVCGKNLRVYLCASKRIGSPPRVREKPPRLLKGVKVFGITPACAGKTRSQD